MNYKKTRYKGKIKHFSVGALIKKDNKFLLIDRKKVPYGWAPPAGHIDEGETSIQALKREVKEEANLKVKSFKLIKKFNNLKFGCRRIGSYHEIYVYSCKWSGNLKIEKSEAKRYKWYKKEELSKIKLEAVWKKILKELKIL
ncbi:MAG: NUDIX hydrolase [Candidatus Nanoarchaeia archaeon]|nr:NUDIX hydrolase [Candidatus Nanoarchaeia archaeon]